MSLTARIVLYSLTIPFGISQTVVAAFAAGYSVTDFWAEYDQTAGPSVAAAWALLTWVWASVLLSYNNRPLSTHPLVRALAHFTSFGILSIGWFAISIALGTQIPTQCDLKVYSNVLDNRQTFCALGGTSVALAVLLWGLCTASATIVYLAARATGAGLNTNVVHGDHKSESGA